MSVKKVLVIRFRRIGDAVLSVVICSSIRKSFPEAEIHYVLNDHIAPLFENHPDIDGVIAGLEEGNLKKIATSMGNVLENVTIPDYPIIEDIKNVMKEEGALNAMMSGSGPTVFGIFDDKKLAKNAGQKIKELELTKQVYVVNVHNNRRK